MRLIIYFFSVLFIFLISINRVQSQNKLADKEIKEMLREFYTAYNTTWSTCNMQLLKYKLDSLQRKYCTKKLIQQVKEYGLDHDPLIGDDYTDVEHLKTLSITKDSSQPFAYTIYYIAHTLSASNKPIDEKVIIHLTVAKEGDIYKVASIK
ncbi:MAG: hypothetical protein JSR71_13235 [Proteobacteria bacterium]|nr:hypothetical protein [Pseudomonadota bacterium]